MANYTSKFTDIDLENATLEELEAEHARLVGLSGYFETKQLALKTFINSVYGATASKYFIGHNTAVAESITLQGQDLNHYSENCVNKYFRGIFQSAEHYNKIIYVKLFEFLEKWPLDESTEFCAKNKDGIWVTVNLPIDNDSIMKENYSEEIKNMLKKVFVKTTFGKHLGITFEQASSVDINRGRVTEQLPLNHKSQADNFSYLGKSTYLEDDPSCSMTVAGDTDSCMSDTKIYLDNSNVTIEDAFTKCKYENFDTVLTLENGQEIVPVHNHSTKAFDQDTPFLPVDRPIKYIMRHKVSKGKFKIKSKLGKEVIVTEDHSCMVIRDNKLISIKAKDINPKTDKFVEIINN